jgi:hypothetical protein
MSMPRDASREAPPITSNQERRLRLAPEQPQCTATIGTGQDHRSLEAVVPARRGPNVYRVEVWGSPESFGVSDTYHVTLRGFAKLDSTASPYCVANEYVVGRLGAVLGLPIPPGAIVESGDGRKAWVTLSFVEKGIRLPPVDPGELVADQPDVAAACIVFDALVANFDRHAGNLAHRRNDHRVEIFDHSHSLLGTQPAGGHLHLAAMRGRLVVDGKVGGVRHCLIDHVREAQALLGYAEEIASTLSDGVVERVCADAAALGIGLDDTLATELMIWLRDRRDNMTDLLRANGSEFTAIAPGDWGIV